MTGMEETGVARWDIRRTLGPGGSGLGWRLWWSAPMAPPGWFAAKTVGVSRPESECSVSATLRARLSPSARVMVVDVVGAEKPKEAVSVSWRVVGRRKFWAPERAGWVSRGHVSGLVCAVMMMMGMRVGICLTS